LEKRGTKVGSYLKKDRKGTTDTNDNIANNVNKVNELGVSKMGGALTYIYI